MSHLDVSNWNTGVEPMEVTLPGGETVRFLTLLDLPMEEAQQLMEAGLAAEKIGSRVSPDTLAQLMAILRTMIHKGLSPEDQKKWVDARIPTIAAMRLLPELSMHYRASDGSFAAMQMNQTATPTPAPQPQYSAPTNFQVPSATDLVAQAPAPQPQYPWQAPEVMTPGEGSVSPTSSPAFGVNSGETSLNAGTSSAFGQMTPTGTPNYSN